MPPSRPSRSNADRLQKALDEGRIQSYVVRQEIGADGRIGQRSLQQVEVDHHYDSDGQRIP